MKIESLDINEDLYNKFPANIMLLKGLSSTHRNKTGCLPAMFLQKIVLEVLNKTNGQEKEIKVAR